MLKTQDCSSNGRRRRRWSFPPTGDMDSTSLPGITQHDSQESIDKSTRSEEPTAKLSFMKLCISLMVLEIKHSNLPLWIKVGFMYFVDRCLRSFVVYISIAQATVFYFHLLFLHNQGLTVTFENLSYLEVKQKYKHVWGTMISLKYDSRAGCTLIL